MRAAQAMFNLHNVTAGIFAIYALAIWAEPGVGIAGFIWHEMGVTPALIGLPFAAAAGYIAIWRPAPVAFSAATLVLLFYAACGVAWELHDEAAVFRHVLGHLCAWVMMQVALFREAQQWIQ